VSDLAYQITGAWVLSSVIIFLLMGGIAVYTEDPRMARGAFLAPLWPLVVIAVPFVAVFSMTHFIWDICSLAFGGKHE
jgi:hypothetical protein